MSRRGGRGKTHHKGRRRHFTDAEELQMEMEREKRRQEWREKKEGDGSDEEGATAEKPEASSEEESDSEEEQVKPKGVSGLIEIENPNRVTSKTKKASELTNDDSSTVQLSRREREEIERQRTAVRTRKLQEEGKTDQARADLARLAVIRRQREEAARKKEEQKKAKEAADAVKNAKR